MPWSIYKRDLVFGVRNECERPDRLRDRPELLLDPGGVPERVEERRLAVVDVPHDRDDGGSLDDPLLGGAALVLYELDFLVEFEGEGLDGVLGEDLELVGVGLAEHELLETREEQVGFQVEEAGEAEGVRAAQGDLDNVLSTPCGRGGADRGDV